MSFAYYVSWAFRQAEALQEAVESARSELGQASKASVEDVIRETQEQGRKAAAVRVATATPAEFDKLMAKVPRHRQVATLRVAAMLAREGADLLEAIEGRLQTGRPYRKVHHDAILIAMRLDRPK